MKFVLEIDLENDDLYTRSPHRIGRLVQEVASQLRQVTSGHHYGLGLQDTGRIRDVNGNWVGWWKLMEESEALVARVQLPEGMKDCTIRFKQCEKGHGWLTATNWVKRGCLMCELDDALVRAETAEKKAAEHWSNLCDVVVALGKIAPEAAIDARGWAAHRMAQLDEQRERANRQSTRADSAERELDTARAVIAEKEKDKDRLRCSLAKARAALDEALKGNL